jgi:small basic protein
VHPTFRNILAIVAGITIGSIVNMGLISVSASAIPPPAGADVNTMEGLKASMHLFEPKHFVFPFLAHALGTLAGAFVTAYVAACRQLAPPMAIGLVFLAGGISMVFALPSPLWFDVLDLGAAYIPMAWIGWKLAARMGRPAITGAVGGNI